MKYFFLIRYCFLVCFLAFSFSFANFDTVNRQSCSCSPNYYWGGWTPYNIYEERQHYLVAYGSGQITWKCSKNASNGCSNPNCSVNSSCSIHNTSCSCSYGGGTPTGTFNRRPRWQCLTNPTVNLTNAHPVSNNELPPSYTLPQNFSFSIVSYTEETSGAANANATKCEYACNLGYVRDTLAGVTQCRLALCLANPAIGANTNNVGPANSYPLAGDELPTSLTFTQDYQTTLRWSIGATQYIVAEIDRSGTGAGCEYTCNAGYIPDGVSSCRLPICLPNTAIGVTANNTAPANASPISSLELPSSLTLVRDYTTQLISDPNRRTELNTAAGCEYTCNDGFKIGPKTAAAESNSTGTFAKITHGGGGYTTPPTVQVTGGTCTTLPTAVATINSSGSVDSITLNGAVNCTIAPTLTIGAPTDTMSRCIATQCLGFAKPLNATYCSGDTTLAGHDDGLNVRRADSSGCTSNAKCEWYCPAATPFYCESSNTCVASQNECGQTNTCKTSAPSELKTETDLPLIQCDAINATNTHFRYKITKTGGTGVQSSTTSTNPNLTVTKLLAKADASGNCPSNASAYVANLTDIVANDKVCVRLVYNNATTGAISNALITDSLPAGFTRVTNSTKNCLTPTGSSELCSDASGMGGAIGNNGWSGNNFSLTPHAGFYAIPTNKMTGDFMAMGKKRYAYSRQCSSFGGIEGESSIYGFGNTNSSIFNGCGLSGILTNSSFDTLGFKNYSWIACAQHGGQEGEVFIPGFLNESSKSYPTSVCPYSSIYQNFVYSMTDRYAHWLKCVPTGGQEGEEFIHGFTNDANDSVIVGTSNINCGLSSIESKGIYDTLDVTNGKGYIQYTVQATTTPSNLAFPNVTLVGTTTTAETSRANATINSQSSVSGNGDPYISPLFTVGTSVKHPTTFYAGTYTVTCLYGTAANTNNTLPDYGMTPDTTCNKTMTVKDDANGCSRIYPYRGSTLSNEMSSPSAFDASFRCGSRQTVTNTADTKAYRLQIGTGDPAFLAYDRTITDLFAGLAIGPVSTQTQNYNFTSGTDVSCAAKVGDGYSTNPSCQLRTCTGSSCANPQTFIVVPSEEITCTNQDSISYDVGCNPASPDYTQCLQWIYAGTPTSGNTYTRNAKIKVNNVEQDIYFQCKIDTPEGALGPVKTCTIQLPTGGMPVTIFAGDANTTNNSTNYSFQTTAYTLKKDTGKPVGSIAYYTNYSNGVTLSQDQYDYWQKQPITAVITCTDKASTTATGEPTTNGETDGPGCACATTLTNLTNTTPTATEQAEIDQWSLGLPSTNTNIGPDIMTYSRVITNNKGALVSLKVQDTAGNKSTNPLTANFGIDSTEPKLVATKTSNSVTLAFTETHGGASGFWKPLSAFGDTLPAGVLRGTTANNSAIIYRIGSKTNLSALEFGPECSPLPVKNTNYFKYSETSSAPTTQTLTLPSFDVNNNIVAYCVQDNAGNINRGYYPNNLTGCFSSSAMPTIPTLSPSTLASHYAPFLKTKLTSTTLSNNEKYGYSFSENPTNASCFRGILSTNITTLVTNQLNPRPAGEITLDNWTTKLSTIKNTTTPNGNGYYYYDLGTTTNNTLTITAPTGTGTKSVIVDGGNIQINSNIEYTGTGKTLLLIARKNSAGQGGNIYINPTVTRVDAIIIADGGSLMNGTTTNGTTTTKNWITNATDLTNRLTINGRVYSYNTRGGSITPQVTPGTDFDPITTNIGKYFDTTSATTPLIATGTPTQAATYDLERLRVMLSDGNSQCTTHVNYQAFTTSTLPVLLVRPKSFEGGNCNF